jgi:molybdopterin-guanine dinucleotide biosynthesis protein A
MGMDKARVELGGETLLERALQLLDGVTADVRIACGPTPRYEECARELVLDREPDLGPLGGLEAALSSADTDYVVAVACDMPRLEASLIRELVDTALARGLDACVLRSRRGVEPLCGVWRVSMSTPIRSVLERNERRVVAVFDELLDNGARPAVGFVDVDDDEFVRNVNTPSDLEAEGRR